MATRQAALTLEQAIINQNGPLEKLVGLLDAELTSLLAGLQNFLQQQEEDSPAPPPGESCGVSRDDQELLTKLEKLAKLCTINDMGAEDVFTEIEGTLLQLWPKHSNQLQECLDNLDFNGATTVIEQMLAQ